MNFFKLLAIPGLLFVFSNASFAAENETVKEKTDCLYSGKDWYYDYRIYHFTWPDTFAPNSDGLWEILPNTRAISGEFLQPREFWSKPMREQLILLKDAIIGSNILETVRKHYYFPWVSYSHSPSGKPYKQEEETRFIKAVVPVLQEFCVQNGLNVITEEEFVASTRVGLIPDRFFSGNPPLDAPLIRHFDKDLCPLYGNFPSSTEYPSHFEIIVNNITQETLTPKVPLDGK